MRVRHPGGSRHGSPCLGYPQQRDPKEVLEGIVWILKTGGQWHELPKEYPAYQTCQRTRSVARLGRSLLGKHAARALLTTRRPEPHREQRCSTAFGFRPCPLFTGKVRIY